MKKWYSQFLRLSCLSYLGAILAGFCIVGCESGSDSDGGGNNVTFAQYNAITANMSYSAVLGIMGRNPDSSTAGQLLDGVQTVYTWKGSNYGTEFIIVDIIDPPVTVVSPYQGAASKSCNIYDSNHTLKSLNQQWF